MRGQGNYNAFAEAIRLIHKFFPESRREFSIEKGVSIYNFLAAMKFCGGRIDNTCDPFVNSSKIDKGLNKKGGFIGERDMVFDRLLKHARFSPVGRCVVIPDVVQESGWSSYPLAPIVCDWKMVGQRLVELDAEEIFGGSSFDSLFVFESGEAMGVDHDNVFMWAKSKNNEFVGSV